MRYGTKLGLAVVTLALGCAAWGARASGRLEELERALNTRPADAQAAADLGAAYRAEGAAERGVRFFEGFHARHAPNSMSLVWQGSLKALASSSGEDMEARLNLLQAGIADMDRAVRAHPDNPRVRVVRGVTISYFPSFLGMSGKAIRDLETALKAAATLGPNLATVAREGLARAYRQAGRSTEADALAAAPAPGK